LQETLQQTEKKGDTEFNSVVNLGAKEVKNKGIKIVLAENVADATAKNGMPLTFQGWSHPTLPVIAINLGVADDTPQKPDKDAVNITALLILHELLHQLGLDHSEDTQDKTDDGAKNPMSNLHGGSGDFVLENGLEKMEISESQAQQVAEKLAEGQVGNQGTTKSPGQKKAISIWFCK